MTPYRSPHAVSPPNGPDVDPSLLRSAWCDRALALTALVGWPLWFIYTWYFSTSRGRDANLAVALALGAWTLGLLVVGFVRRMRQRALLARLARLP